MTTKGFTQTELHRARLKVAQRIRRYRELPARHEAEIAKFEELIEQARKELREVEKFNGN